MSAKFIIVAGGVYSGTGKGVAAASIGLLMRLRGFKVQIAKFDPYLNVNAGILSPGQHGECFLCDDGSETDLDLGHYERIAGIEMSGKNICTSGTLYKQLIQRQERGDFLGQTVQTIPHLTNAIQDRLVELGKDVDIVLAEIGGTVGDAESYPFYESIRQFKEKYNGDVLISMVAPIIWNATTEEWKTKPIQNSLKELNRAGLHANLILCRCPADKTVHPTDFDKIADLTGAPRNGIFEAPDVDSIYKVPMEFYTRHVDDYVAEMLHLKRTPCRIYKLRELLEKPLNKKVEIGVFGKYVNACEAYVSLKEALKHAGWSTGTDVKINWFKAEDLENKSDETITGYFEGLSGVIIPGGFDKRGVDGKIRAIKYCRENKIPFLGICLGLQTAVIEYATNVLKLDDADSLEFDEKCKNPVIHYVEGQKNIATKSATMRLGAYECELTKGSIAFEFYGKKTISERHRHRLEVNPKYVDQYTESGFRVSGTNPQSGLIEIMELDRTAHPYFVGTQAHPEYRSRLTHLPHCLWV